MEKYWRARQATGDNMAHAHWKMDTLGYKYALRMCNTHCFSTAIVVARTRLSVTFYVHCLSCSSYIRPETAVLPAIYDESHSACIFVSICQLSYSFVWLWTTVISVSVSSLHIACVYRLFLEKHYGAVLLFKNGDNILKAFVFTRITEKTILVENCVRVNENCPLVLLCSEMCAKFF